MPKPLSRVEGVIWATERVILPIFADALCLSWLLDGFAMVYLEVP